MPSERLFNNSSIVEANLGGLGFRNLNISLAIVYSGSKEPGVRYKLSYPSGTESHLIPIAKPAPVKIYSIDLFNYFLQISGIPLATLSIFSMQQINIRRLVNWPMWDSSNNSEIDRILADNKSAVKEWLKSKGLTTGYLMGAPE